MKRVWMMAFVSGAVLVAGCGVASYNDRTANTLKHMKFKQGIDDNLEPPAEGKFKDLNVYLRVPKRLAESGPTWTLPPGSFDQAATFTGAPEQAKMDDGTTAAALPPLKVHVLVRHKPKKPAVKKGEAPPPPDPLIANRGEFIGEVRQVMAADFGPEATGDKKPAAETIGDMRYKVLKFLAANGDNVRVYFARDDKSETDVAVVCDVPTALLNKPMVTKGVDYMLRDLALGAAAKAKFNGGSAPGPGGEGKAPEGPAF